ncbi:transporter major facilitator subfamily protein [Anaeramoeba ignava]|uniref:Transporter major facilitator subfamily protein n=1 Tax=Anaeramoeba ignava TaxID=1746090 RepID=A0A9Q0RDU8_ANAIG|nr:transporter major facilitator subfamily protein [Anaeramoeba ignava]
MKNSQIILNKKTFWWKAIQIFIIAGVDFFAETLTTPMVAHMVKKKFHVKSSMVGTASGAIVGAYTFSQFLSTFYLGHLSDNFGRKIVMTISLTASMIGMVLFGFAWSLAASIIIKLCDGLLNATSPMSKAIMSDLTMFSLNKYRTVFFGFLEFSLIFARSIGALTTSFAFDESAGISWLKNYPYMLPCLFGALFEFITLIFMIIVYRDLPKPEEIKKATENTSLLEKSKNENLKSNDENENQKSNDENEIENENENENGIENQKLNMEFLNDENQNLFFPKRKRKLSLVPGLKAIWKSSVLKVVIFMCGLTHFGNSSTNVAWVLFSSMKKSENGLDFSPKEIGFIYVVLGLESLIFLFFIYKPLTRKIGIKKTFLFGSLSLVVGNLVFPLSSFIYKWFGDEAQKSPYTWILISLIMIPSTCGFVTMLPNLFTMAGNISAYDRQGLVMGTLDSISSLAQGLGPIFGGAVFSLAVVIGFTYLYFIIVALLYLLCFIAIYRVKEVDYQKPNLGIN